LGGKSTGFRHGLAKALIEIDGLPSYKKGRFSIVVLLKMMIFPLKMGGFSMANC